MSGRVEAWSSVAPAATTPPPTSNSLVMNECEQLLSGLMTNEYGWVFNVPVDPVKLNIPDYFTIIKHPTDLGTVMSKIKKGVYNSCPLDFAADVRRTFSNAMTYNPPGNDVFVMAERLSIFFEERWKLIENKYPAVTKDELQNYRVMNECEKLLSRLMSHPYGWVFLKLVDPVKLNIPDYFTVIKHPMDLGTVMSKIKKGVYNSCPSDFAADVRRTFSNAMTYNPPGNDVLVMAETLSKYFEHKWNDIEKKYSVLMSDDLRRNLSLLNLGS